jgi:uncharacterized protein YjbI with pentapeptide repeats
MKRFRLPSPAMVVALGALMLSVGGNVTAAALLTSAGIQDNTIRSVDIRDETIRGRDVDNGSLTGADVRNGRLTGADVNESSLRKVPNADKVDGVDSSRLLRRGQSFTRQFSCAGTTWENASSVSAYTVSGPQKHGQASFPRFDCNVDIPTGATVTAASFVVRDTSSAGNVSCAMYRTNMTTAIGVQLKMADAMTNAIVGNVRITDTTIDFPVVDTANFSYSLSCAMGASDASTGLYGAIITYNVNAAAG